MAARATAIAAIAWLAAACGGPLSVVADGYDPSAASAEAREDVETKTTKAKEAEIARDEAAAAVTAAEEALEAAEADVERAESNVEIAEAKLALEEAKERGDREAATSAAEDGVEVAEKALTLAGLKLRVAEAKLALAEVTHRLRDQEWRLALAAAELAKQKAAPSAPDASTKLAELEKQEAELRAEADKIAQDLAESREAVEEAQTKISDAS